MLDTATIVAVALAYLGLLFAIAWYGDRRADTGRSLIRSPVVYTFSLAVYCTSWTFYGAVGTAARRGIEFLTIYTGPTIIFLGWWFLLRKIARISKSQRITSIADFIASRYGKSASLGMIVTVIAMIGTMPYIALQLKAVSTSFAVLVSYEATPDLAIALTSPPAATLTDAAFLTAIGMAVFAILFGTRHIDANEHHEGMVAAIAFESCVKLLAFLAVGFFAIFTLGSTATPGAGEAAMSAGWSNLTQFPEGGSGRFLTMTFLSMAAIVCLPRQFHITIVENVDERHLSTASWLFPTYLFLMSLFVLPIAAAGLSLLPAGANPDFYVLTVPMTQGHNGLALLAFIGGLSSATAMVVVAAIALSTMICNDLVMPVLLRIRWLRLEDRGNLATLLLYIRRIAIFAVLLLGYAYYRLTGESGPLAQIGLVSFAVAAQFFPAIIGALFWKNGTRAGAQTGLILGFLTWAYTMLVPLLARSDLFSGSILEPGPWGISALRPEALFGLEGWEPLTHALFWSMAANICGYVVVSLFSKQDTLERIQAAIFVDVFRRPPAEAQVWRRSAAVEELHALLQRFIGAERADRAFRDYAAEHGQRIGDMPEADADLVAFVERLLAGSVGAASARGMVASIAKGELLGFDEVMAILEETHQVIAHSREIEQKSRELEATALELTRANAQLKELDRLKDDFLSTVSHELRTPLTSIRTYSEILSDHDVSEEQADRFLDIISSETQRLTRLLDTILDLTRLEQGQAEWRMADVDPSAVLEDAVATTGGLFRGRQFDLKVAIEPSAAPVRADRDRLMQVFINLLSNAAKFAEPGDGRVMVVGRPDDGGYLVEVTDNGEGVSPQDRELIFEKFAKARDRNTGRPSGSGLGLTISRHIVEHHGGRIWTETPPTRGARFCVHLHSVRPPSGSRKPTLVEAAE
ncbi:sensor histidine kinase [Bauldia litoralis]|uniref:sensor histidine kinase n=1 Tax=Bauldia litoralis TaxID=665467 RepID=UPI0032997701